MACSGVDEVSLLDEIAQILLVALARVEASEGTALPGPESNQ